MLVHADRYSQAFYINAKKGKDPKYDRVSYEYFASGKVPENEMWKYSSFWYKDFDGMAYKTMLRQLISKWGIMSIEMQEAYTKDMATIRENGDYEYIENISEDTEARDDVTNNNENTPIEVENVIVKDNKDVEPKLQINTNNGVIDNNIEEDFFN